MKKRNWVLVVAGIWALSCAVLSNFVFMVDEGSSVETEQLKPAADQSYLILSSNK